MLLGLPVRAGGVRLGTVAAVWVDASDVTVGVEIANGWARGARFLPLPAARVGNDAVCASPHALLSDREAAFYERNGARRVATGDARDTLGRAADQIRRRAA